MRKQSGWEFVLIDDGGRLLGRFHFHAEAENMKARELVVTQHSLINIGSTILLSLMLLLTNSRSLTLTQMLRHRSKEEDPTSSNFSAVTNCKRRCLSVRGSSADRH